MELDLEKLAGYLPYGLKWKLDLGSDTCLGTNVFTMSGLTEETLYTKEGNVFHWAGQVALFPCFRPLSSLTKVIDVDGKSFIPIIELARLENGGGVFDYQIEKLLIEESGYIGLYYTSSIGLVEFSYDPKFMTFTMMLRHKDESYKCDLMVNHQLEMFQKLHEWHFDIYGLIDKGLAIAIED